MGLGQLGLGHLGLGRLGALLSGLLLCSLPAQAITPALPVPARSSVPVTPLPPVPSLPSSSPPGPLGVPEGNAPLLGSAGVPFGTPRFSTNGSTTRAVFDLPTGVTYTLTPTFTGLRLDLRGIDPRGPELHGAGMRALDLQRPGAAIAEYLLTPAAATGGLANAQAMLVTPFPLGVREGWTAHETNIVTGGQVLILTLGSTLNGGADSTVSGNVQTVAAPTSAPAPLPSTGQVTGVQPGAVQSGMVPSAAVQPLPSAAGRAAVQPLAVPSGVPVSSDQLPPGDVTAPQTPATLPSRTPALAGSTDVSRLTSGVIAGTPPLGPGFPLLGAPRLGKNPGLTRVVLDLPPGTAFRVTPLPLGLRVDLSGVSAASSLLQSQPVSPELQGWSVAPTLTGLSLTFVTGSPITLRSGWRDVLLPPGEGSTLSRLALDLAPALADTTPLGTQQLPPLATARRSFQAFSGGPLRPRVVLDPGHGGIDPGATGAVTEKVVTLDIARRVRTVLNAAGIDVLMTRDSDTQLSRDKSTDLSMRAALGSGSAQLYVSIHVNSTEGAALLHGYGIETWWNRNNPGSQALAQNLQQDVIASTAAYSRGLQSGRSLAVLRENRLPAALVEVGFTSHPVDGQNLLDTNYLDRVAYGIAAGIRDTLQAGVGGK